jgi:hypothetical protein
MDQVRTIVPAGRRRGKQPLRENDMSQVRCVALALAGMGVVALTTTAEAQAPYGYYGPRYYSPWYSYGAPRANGSVSPWGWDQDNPRDFQLQGTR